MFTGIVQGIGRIARHQLLGADSRLWVASEAIGLDEMAAGESIAVNGVCLTVVECGATMVGLDVSQETLSTTSLGALEVGASVNLERPVVIGQPLGGHLVSGHVDGLGVIASRRAVGRSVRFDLESPPDLARYVAPKGSICIDGVSLTVNEVSGPNFSVNVIPHTLQVTIMGDYQTNQRVNLEVDIIARYLERLIAVDRITGMEGGSELGRELLERYGHTNR